MKNRITIYLGLIMTALLALSIIVYMGQDHKAPVINVPEGELTYTEGEDTDVLLVGVTATDDEDDNLSSSVRIYDIAVMEDGNQALVTYAVYDNSNNLGKATKMVKYVAGRDKQSETKVEESSNSSADDSDKEESDKKTDAKTTEKTTESKKTTEEPVEEGYEDPEMVSDGAPVLKLNTHEVHIDVGDYFYTMDYVDDAVDDIDSREYLFRNMYLDSTYDEYTAGVYELIYYCVDSDGNRSNDAKLKLYVGQDEDED